MIWRSTGTMTILICSPISVVPTRPFVFGITDAGSRKRQMIEMASNVEDCQLLSIISENPVATVTHRRSSTANIIITFSLFPISGSVNTWSFNWRWKRFMLWESKSRVSVVSWFERRWWCGFEFHYHHITSITCSEKRVLVEIDSTIQRQYEVHQIQLLTHHIIDYSRTINKTDDLQTSYQHSFLKDQCIRTSPTLLSCM